MSVNHYENFPVASVLLPSRLRPAVKAIYAFARSADDIADEGDANADVRLAALYSYEQELGLIAEKQPTPSALFHDLAMVIQDYQLPLQPFHDLLSAFSQDIIVTRYFTFNSLMDYCRRSAQPVGRLMLQLYNAANAENCRDSDAICCALQLINFWQDVAIDMQKKRIYLPQEDLHRFNVTENQIGEARMNDAWRDLMRFEIVRTRQLIHSGMPLALRLPGRIGWELRMVIQGGLRILERIEAIDYDIFRRRPQLGLNDWMHILWRSMRM